MSKRLNLIGQKFGRLTVIDCAGHDERGASLFLCRCQCGNNSTVYGNNLKTVHTRSCGCYAIEKIKMTQTGKVLSEETRNKISKAKKGCPAWNKGKPSPLKGVPRSEETKKKLSIANKGNKHSKESRLKMSLAKIGKMTGDFNPAKQPSVRKKISASKKGKPRSEETKKKISKALMGRKLTKEHIKNMMRRRIPSSLEKKFEDIVVRNNLPYKYTGNGSFIIGNCNPDFININGEKIAVEVYSRFYKEKDGRKIDKWKQTRSTKFAEYGWSIIYFDETEVKEDYVLSILNK